MAAELLRRLEVQAGEAAIVGDRISTDVAMSRSLGMTSVLVLSGVTAADEAARSPQRPDYVIDGIAALLPDEPRADEPRADAPRPTEESSSDRVRVHADPPRPDRGQPDRRLRADPRVRVALRRL
jgi:hypothetical protein